MKLWQISVLSRDSFLEWNAKPGLTVERSSRLTYSPFALTAAVKVILYVTGPVLPMAAANVGTG